VLVDPTRYLGNLLIAGGLIQAFAAHCRAQDIAFTLVVDAAFTELLQHTLPDGTLLPYPRGAIKRANLMGKLFRYVGFLRTLRGLHADIAFNIEEDSTSDRLTRWSGARYRLGCSALHRGRGYQRVVPVELVERPAARRHRWYSFMEVFATLGLPEPAAPGYLHFPPDALPAPPLDALTPQGFDTTLPYAALHAGATKDYKRWPPEHFARLAVLLREAGMQVVLIGAGSDAQQNAAVLAAAGETSGIFDATNRFTLAELGGFLGGARAMVGNDSGPFHLASALGVPGAVIFGPTDAGLWAPLGARAQILQHSSVCDPQCSRRHCLYGRRCLQSITPEEVLAALREKIAAQ